MKIVILHGDDTEKSYARLTKFVEVAKKRSWEINYFDDPAIPIEDSLTSVSLFGNERFFILKNSRKISKKDYDWIKKITQIFQER
jgi:DNA polymerase III delta subunit